MMAKETLTLSQEIDIAMIKLGLIQSDVVDQLRDKGIPMNASKFSIKKSCGAFTGDELKGLNKILNTKF